jgi:hypothetical protein
MRLSRPNWEHQISTAMSGGWRTTAENDTTRDWKLEETDRNQDVRNFIGRICFFRRFRSLGKPVRTQWIRRIIGKFVEVAHAIPNVKLFAAIEKMEFIENLHQGSGVLESLSRARAVKEERHGFPITGIRNKSKKIGGDRGQIETSLEWFGVIRILIRTC